MFILSSNAKLEPELSNYDRLYAYPNLPNITNDKMIILDSGAFGLSCSGKKMTDEYIKNLGEHYLKYMQDNVFCIAPDVFKNPTLSIRQFEYFKTLYKDLNVSPVIQFTEPVADIFSAKKQIKVYSTLCNPKMICISNHKFNVIKQTSALQRICKMIRDAFGDIKIHALGAGFNYQDVSNWMKTGITSMDSISYYTDAKSKQEWVRGQSSITPSALNFKELALKNAQLAIEAAQ